LETTWHILITKWEKYFFAEPIIFILLIFAITLGWISYKRDKKTILILLYLTHYTVLYIFLSYVNFIFKLNFNPDIFKILFLSTGALESISIGLYFSNCFKKRKFILFAKYFSYIFFSIYVIYFSYKISSGEDLNKIDIIYHLFASIQLLFFCLFSFIYFYEFMISNKLVALNKRPSFWIVSSILLVCIIKIPIHPLEAKILIKYILLERIILSIQFYAFGMFIVSLIYSFLWKMKIST